MNQPVVSDNAVLIILPGVGGAGGNVGLALLQLLMAMGHVHQAFMISRDGGVPIAIEAEYDDTAEFRQSPVVEEDTVAFIEHAVKSLRPGGEHAVRTDDTETPFAHLTPRQREVMEMVLAGSPSKNIAFDLGISRRTVENHRAEIMRRTGAKSLPALARLAIAAA